MFGLFQKKSQYIQRANEILEKKEFTEDIKKLYLEMFEDVEKNYDNYMTVKIEVPEKAKFLEKLLKILNLITEIEIIDEKKDKDLGKKNQIKEDNSCEIYEAIVNKEENKVKIYNTKLSAFNSLLSIKPRIFEIKDDYEYSDILSRVLQKGSKSAELELLNDFNEYIWERKPICNLDDYSKVLYQDFLWMFGYEFMNKWKQGNQDIKNYIHYIRVFLIKNYGENNAKNIMKHLERVLYSLAEEKERKELIKNYDDDKKTLEMMKNVEEFIEFLSKERKELNIKVKKIDQVLNTTELLVEAFAIKKKNLIQQEGIKEFTLNEYKLLLEKEREKSVQKINEYTELQKPEKFADYKKELRENIKFSKNPNIDTAIVEFQLAVLDGLYEMYKNITDEKEILKQTKMLRYSRYMKYAEGKEGYLNPEIYQKMDKLLKVLVLNGTNKGVFKKVSQEFYTNYTIISPALKTDIVNFDDIYIEVYMGRTVLLHVYNMDILNNEIELIEVNPKNVLIKSKKKYKIFEDRIGK